MNAQLTAACNAVTAEIQGTKNKVADIERQLASLAAAVTEADDKASSAQQLVDTLTESLNKQDKQVDLIADDPLETARLIQGQMDNGLCVPKPGVYPIAKTLAELVRGDKMPTNPTIFRGAGVDVYGRKDSRMSTGQGTVLKWVGEPGGTMIDVRTDGSRYEHFTLDGNKLAGIGMQWSRVGSGAASPSNTVIDWVRVERCTRAAWRVGHTVNDPQGDSIDFNNCRVWDCPIGLEVENTQAMQHLFRGHTWMQYVPQCFVYKSGGILRVEGQLFVISPEYRPRDAAGKIIEDQRRLRQSTVLTLLAPSFAKKPGKYNGDFHISWCQSDEQNYGGFRLLDMQPGVDWSGVRVVSNGGRIAGEGATVEFANIGKNAELRLDGWTNVKRSDINVAEGGRLKAENMYGHFYGQPWDYDWTKAGVN